MGSRGGNVNGEGYALVDRPVRCVEALSRSVSKARGQTIDERRDEIEIHGVDNLRSEFISQVATVELLLFNSQLSSNAVRTWLLTPLEVSPGSARYESPSLQRPM